LVRVVGIAQYAFAECAKFEFGKQSG